ncbi:hypothetical protein [Aliivibrio logei]|uniref:hypothetical protein n=1 Tax=Aliivibrio logei TaxID=688 RepID=UPI0035C8A51C
MSNKHILVANSETSFLDLCTNNLVSGCDVYCTFEVCEEDMGWMKRNLKRSHGHDLLLRTIPQRKEKNNGLIKNQIKSILYGYFFYGFILFFSFDY